MSDIKQDYSTGIGWLGIWIFLSVMYVTQHIDKHGLHGEYYEQPRVQEVILVNEEINND